MKFNKYLPLVTVSAYFVLVFILFVYGPWPWPVNNYSILILFLLSAHTSLALGYLSSINNRRKYLLTEKKYIFKIDFFKLLSLLVLLNFVLVIPLFFMRSGFSFNLSSLLDNISKGISNPGEMYQDKLQKEASSSSIIYMMLIVSHAFLKYLIVPNVIYYWKQINISIKIFMILTLIIETLSWISIGTNKGIFDNLFIIIFSLLIKYLYLIKKIPIRIIIFSFTIFILACTYFSNAIISRSGKVNTYNKFASINVNHDSIFLKYLPTGLDNFIIMISSYLTQGYYGLSLGLREDFTSTYGFGNSWFLMNVYDIFGDRNFLEEKSLIFKIHSYGWDPYINWHSIYTWLASDFSFFGVILIMYILGKLFANLVKDIKCNKNLFSKSLLVLIMVMFVYFPANNQIFAFVDTFATFWILFGLWVLSSKLSIIDFRGVRRNVSKSISDK